MHALRMISMKSIISEEIEMLKEIGTKTRTLTIWLCIQQVNDFTSIQNESISPLQPKEIAISKIVERKVV